MSVIKKGLIFSFLVLFALCMSNVASAWEFRDDFNRDPVPDTNEDIGNGWVEKDPDKYFLENGRIRIAYPGTENENHLSYRPEDENLRDVEVSVEFEFDDLSTGVGYPNIFARQDYSTASIEGIMDSYLLYIKNTSGEAYISRKNDGVTTPLVSIALDYSPSSGFTVGMTYRLRLRVEGSDQVKLDGWVERWNGTGWDILGHGSFTDSSSDRFDQAGAVGFGSDTETNYSFDNFVCTRLANGAWIWVTPKRGDLGIVEMGGTSTAKVTVENFIGADNDLIINDLSLTGSNANAFGIQNNNCASPIIPSGQCTFEVAFSPSPASFGTKGAVLSISSNDPDKDIIDMPLMGTNVPPTVWFYDDFNRDPLPGTNEDIGNGWIEKDPDKYYLENGRVHIAYPGTENENHLTYRPEGENLLDVEVSVEVEFDDLSTGPGWPHVFARQDSNTAPTQDIMNSYLLFINNSTSEAYIARKNNYITTRIAQIIIDPALTYDQTYRLRLRVAGVDPVQLNGWVERWTGSDWEIIGEATVEDSSADSHDLAGTVGFASQLKTNFSFDNFIVSEALGSNENPSSVPGVISVDPAAHNFEMVERGSSSSKTFTVTNAGELTSILNFTSISLAGVNNDQFIILSDSCSSSSLTANQTCTIEVAFQPTLDGPSSATLDIDSNSSTGLVQLPLTGIGTPPLTVTEIYTNLGDNYRRKRDIDVWLLYGSAGEKVIITMEIAPPPGGVNNGGEYATLKLKDKVKKVKYKKVDRGSLRDSDQNNQIIATLPADGKYLVIVKEQKRRRHRRLGFEGDYILRLVSDMGAVLTPTRWVE